MIRLSNCIHCTFRIYEDKAGVWRHHETTRTDCPGTGLIDKQQHATPGEIWATQQRLPLERKKLHRLTHITSQLKRWIAEMNLFH